MELRLELQETVEGTNTAALAMLTTLCANDTNLTKLRRSPAQPAEEGRAPLAGELCCRGPSGASWALILEDPHHSVVRCAKDQRDRWSLTEIHRYQLHKLRSHRIKVIMDPCKHRLERHAVHSGGT